MNIIERKPMPTADGKSGGTLERVTLADGTGLVVKRDGPGQSWESRALGDDGRAVRLWESVVLARIPDFVDHAFVGAERDGDGWLVYMRDVSDRLIPGDVTITREQSCRLLQGFNALHEAFRGERIAGLCTIEERATFLSPATAIREPQEEIPRLIGRGWEAFEDLVPRNVADAVFALHDDPAPFVAATECCAQTLIHGDVKLSNVGLSPDGVVLVDWGALTGIAPAPFEFGEYLAVNISRIDATCDELVDDYVALAQPDRRALDLAFVYGVLVLGWNKALLAAHDPHEAVRDREQDDLGWWVAAARRALDRSF